MGWLGKLWGSLFGSGKGIIEQVSDVADKWNPSPVTKHNMAVESATADEAGATSARAMQFQLIGDGKFTRFVAAWNSAMRPMFGTWAFAILIGATFGMIQSTGFQQLDPFSQELVRTIVQFLFGVRIVSQDVPNAAAKIIKALKG
jgi:hypothetical protein